jgi:peptidoglycan-associated lipoprotein
LEWTTANATTVNIQPEVGTVSATGSRSVRPQQSTTYRITAEGPGGTAEASARVTVTSPPPIGDTKRTTISEGDIDTQWMNQVKPIYFDYDQYSVRPDQQATLQSNVRFFQAHANEPITIEGNCDERGSEEYNLGLGDRRANALKEAIVAMGISASRVHTVSYGKERPKCTESNESCWQQNRRGDFIRK